MRRSKCRNSDGFSSILFLTLLIVLLSAGMGILWLHQLWIKEVQKQYRLDKCVEKAALQIRVILEQLDQSNLEMKALKVSAAASTLLAPEAKALLLGAIHMEYLRQEFHLKNYHLISGLWIMPKHCGAIDDFSLPLSQLQIRRAPSDLNGEGLLYSTGPSAQRIILGVQNGKRKSFAKVEGVFGQRIYQSYWVKGTGIY